MLATIGRTVAVVLFISGVIGIINPQWVNLANRKQAMPALILSLILAILVAPRSGDQEAVSPPQAPAIVYTVVERQDTSFQRGGTRGMERVPRYTYRVTVPEGTTEETMIAIAEKLVSEERKRGHVAALTVWFYHPGDEMDGGFTAGMVNYAPDGNVANARTVRVGDYSRHKYAFTAPF